MTEEAVGVVFREHEGKAKIIAVTLTKDPFGIVRA